MRSFFKLILYLKLLKRTQSFFIEELMITEDNFFSFESYATITCIGNYAFRKIGDNAT